jgi:hypothetical protein
MQHDPDLLERLDRLPKESFAGVVFRATRQNLDPLMPSTSGGRWMPRDNAPILYTSLQREGALAEIVFNWSQLTPMPTRPVVLHTLAVVTHRTLKLVRADLAALGVPPAEYVQVNPERTQQIGAAIDYLGCDGLIAPSARWPCDNLMLFTQRFGADNKLEARGSEEVAWIEWGRAHGLIEL